MKAKLVRVMPSFRKKMEQLDIDIEDGLKNALMRMSRTAVDMSPVDTGSYVTSFSFSTGGGRPRGKSSENKPKVANKQAVKDLGYDQLVSDINKLDLRNTTSFNFRNGSPHALDVENGTHWKRTAGYKVFAKIRNIYG
jgi:hypothetical protein|tara:strand:- start:362 stop:775 length:414 start_codon:yes stop_codon:yes gene_type:complete